MHSLDYKTLESNKRFKINFGDSDNLMQVMYQIIAAYNEDNCADELSKEPLFTAILEKERLVQKNDY